MLRFDYSGTGDSAGDPIGASVDGWKEDIGTAIQELKDSSGLKSVSLGGLRLGATLAAAVGMERDDVDAVVLWDPVLDGKSHLESLEMTDAEPPSRPGHNNGFQSSLPPGTLGSGGFPFTPALREQISALNLNQTTGRRGARVEILVSSPEPALEALAAQWNEAGLRSNYRCIPSEGDWAKGDRFGSALIPQDIIQGVVDSLSGNGAR